MVNVNLFSSTTVEWLTPPEVYNPLNDRYHFTTDPCTTTNNHLNCKIFFTKETDGIKNFRLWRGNVFINPPYGREIGKWVTYGRLYAMLGRGTVVMLIPARTDTKWWQNNIGGDLCTPVFAHTVVKFIRGRVKFINSEKGRYSAPFPSAIVVFGE